MSATLTSEFRVEDVLDDEVWVLDRRQGFRAAIQAEDWRYSEQLRRDIVSLSKGQVITATVESQNELHTVWEFSEIEA